MYNKESLLIKEIERNHVIIKGIEIYYEKINFLIKLAKEEKLQAVEPSDEVKEVEWSPKS